MKTNAAIRSLFTFHRYFTVKLLSERCTQRCNLTNLSFEAYITSIDHELILSVVFHHTRDDKLCCAKYFRKLFSKQQMKQCQKVF
jgi:hypothetical protein